MLPLRYPIAWALSGWGLVVFVAVGSVIPGAVITGFSSADKIVHMLSYFLLMIWFSGLYSRQRHVVIALILVTFGGLLEFLQAVLPYRFFDPLDLLANTVGVALGLLLSFTLLAGWCQRIERALGYYN